VGAFINPTFKNEKTSLATSGDKNVYVAWKNIRSKISDQFTNSFERCTESGLRK
jgi:hypothetical protein